MIRYFDASICYFAIRDDTPDADVAVYAGRRC